MTKSLSSMLVVGLLACHAGASHAEQAAPATAYTALRSMGKSLGSNALNRVVEVTGRNGTPQPAVWRIVLTEGGRGTSEIKVEGARIVSQKTSGQPTTLKPIQLPDLNLDSSGAFDAANEQARKAKVPFSVLDYTLRVSATTGKPVWTLALQNTAGTRVGEVRLAAHDGTLIAVNGFNQAASPPPVAAPTAAPRNLVSANADHDAVQPTRVSPSRNTTITTTTTTYNNVQPVPPPQEGGFFSRAGRTLDHTTDAVGDSVTRTGHAVNETMRHTGTRLQRFFTGRGDQEPTNVQPD